MLVHLILAHHILVHAHLRLTHAHSGHSLLWVVSPVVHRSPGWPAGLLLRVALGIAALLGEALRKVVLRKIATKIALILWVPARLGVHRPIPIILIVHHSLLLGLALRVHHTHLILVLKVLLIIIRKLILIAILLVIRHSKRQKFKSCSNLSIVQKLYIQKN